jgi:hypothetical protein
MQRTRYSLQDLRRNLANHVVERGQDYASRGHVHAREYDPAHDHYAARVNGSRAEPYQVEARVVPGRIGASVYGTCTCPMRLNCKHVAAVLVDALARGGTADRKAEPPAPRPNTGPHGRAMPAPPLSPELQGWLQRLERLVPRAPDPEAEQRPRSAPRRLLYILDVPAGMHPPQVRMGLVSVSLRKDGTYADVKPWRGANNPFQTLPRFVSAEDERILRLLRIDGRTDYDAAFLLTGAQDQALRAVLATGRCHLRRFDSTPLKAGPARHARAEWDWRPDASQALVWSIEPPAELVLPLEPPWYVDGARGEAGPLDSGLPPALASALALAPHVPAAEAPAVRAALARDAGDARVPLPQAAEEVFERHAPVPHLTLASEGAYGRGYSPFGFLTHSARLTFDYAGLLVNGPPRGDVRVVSGERVLRIPRDAKTEQRAAQRLAQTGLERRHTQRPEYSFFHDDTEWLRFVAEEVPKLQAEGWQIETDPEFRFRMAELGGWYAEVEEAGNDWFDLDLGVEVDGERMQLLPILVEAVRERPDLLTSAGSGASAGDGGRETLFVELADGRFAAVPIARVRPVLSILHELLSVPESGSVRLPRLDAARLADLDAATELTWSGGEKLRELGARLASFQDIAPVAPPAGLRAALRPYQLQGLAWLQFLREYGLNGVLADDMGLGKTVEALAHILVEKEAGRLARPALVVCPTSLVPNWKAEATRFAPGLRVHVSHGLKRKATFAQMAENDLVITTYPLLSRDREALLEQPFHLAILDEAQQIKNAQTIAAKVVTQLKADHRLCLTGTPLENHLGELWSLFHFLMPGFLGDAKAFRALYRTPIEKHGDDLRRASLARRVRPFMLRRTKEQVARELPAKTEIVVPVEIEGGQRDLYETVRASMDERVRREIAARGLQQSQIIVLDALLKLRQICCDPRLLKLQSARAVKESAKLEALIELLDELLGGGHRVLLFSQFTSMLELIERELDRKEVAYVKLTGDTRDREKPVRAFQSGAIPLFLISLKAGGTGLNLTAADTVVHYDPWWNPAVENQATDRAHRIGQDKPVFVYKLIVSGSVEEKIAKLQAAKAALARGVLDGGEAGGAALTAKDIQALFEPLG